MMTSIYQRSLRNGSPANLVKYPFPNTDSFVVKFGSDVLHQGNPFFENGGLDLMILWVWRGAGSRLSSEFVYPACNTR